MAKEKNVYPEDKIFFLLVIFKWIYAFLLDLYSKFSIWVKYSVLLEYENWSTSNFSISVVTNELAIQNFSSEQSEKSG